MQREGESDLSAPRMQQESEEPEMRKCIKAPPDDDDGYVAHRASLWRLRKDED